MSEKALKLSSTFPEHRYLTIKESDLYQAFKVGAISMSHMDMLREVDEAINKVRVENGKKILKVVVIEENWPEYQPTLELLGERVLAELNAVGG